MHPYVHAARTPDKPAIVMAESGRVVTYRELEDASNRFARLLRARGLRAGDRIALIVENHPRFYELCFGAHRAGLVYTAIGTRLTAAEAAYIVADCGARLVVATVATAPIAVGAAADAPGVEARLMLDGTAPGWEPYEDAVAAQPAARLPDEAAGIDMLYSSGTTGRPKGVRAPPELGPIDAPYPMLGIVRDRYRVDEDSVYLSPAPLYHAAPLRFNMAVLRLGGTCVIMERFDAEAFLGFVERYRATHTQVVPTMFVRMLKLPEAARARADVSSLRCAIHAAAPCPVPVKRAMIDWWGPILWEYYAGTEGNGMTLVDSRDWLAHPGTVGRAVVGELRICDDDGREVPVGETGVVYFAGGRAFEYHGDPEKTAASRHPAGWTTLGDIGRVDAEGYLYLTDRKAYTIISGGVNVYPQETEDLLVTHPDVIDAAVIGVPDEDLGEAVKAVVTPRDMGAAGPALERALIAWCRERLSPVKCPKSIDFEAELPRHATGKLYKRLLRDRYWAGHERRIA
ncbi:MAG TPA: AMP-binding protein [Burkholderiaceae bacterium]|nr:AMP-binding protein [Burkholderiaceae bacterium]